MSYKQPIFNYISFSILTTLYIWLIYQYILTDYWSWVMIPVIIFAWYSADFFLGLAHFYMDYVACPKKIGLKKLAEHPDISSNEFKVLKRSIMKQVGAIDTIAFHFKFHHLYPSLHGTRSIIVLLRQVILIVIPVQLLIVIGIYFDIFHPLVLLYCVIITFGALLGQYAHANTHKDNIPILIQWLQKTRIFLTVEQHHLHHEGFKSSFCILNGWADTPVNTIASWVLKKGWVDPQNLELH